MNENERKEEEQEEREEEEDEEEKKHQNDDDDGFFSFLKGKSTNTKENKKNNLLDIFSRFLFVFVYECIRVYISLSMSIVFSACGCLFFLFELIVSNSISIT